MKATIPSQVILFEKPSQDLEVRWDNFPQDEGVGAPVILKVEKVTSVFPVQADASESTKDTARTWSKGYHVWDPEKKAYVENKWTSPEVPEPNRFSDLRVIDFEVRGHGGRAWKVIDSRNRLFDIREDVLHEAMMSGTVNNGNLQGMEFVWARVGSQMKLVRVGSTFHKACQVASTRSSKNHLDPKSLEVGRVYRDKKGTYSIWLGKDVFPVMQTQEEHQYSPGHGPCMSFPGGWTLECPSPLPWVRCELRTELDGKFNSETIHPAYSVSVSKSPTTTLVEETEFSFPVSEFVQVFNQRVFNYIETSNSKQEICHPNWQPLYNVRNIGRLILPAGCTEVVLPERVLKILKEDVKIYRFNRDESPIKIKGL